MEKEMDIFTYGGKYALDVPGQGCDLPFVEDPHMRLQQWGGNRRSNIVDIDADLKGYTKRLSRDYVGVDEYTRFVPESHTPQYPNYGEAVTDESRAVCPAFLFREATADRWEEPFINPQANTEIPFQWGIQTRILEKDRVGDDSFTAATSEFNSVHWLPLGV
jgi:hypothetical protein